MMNSNDFKIITTEKLKEYCERVYFSTSPENAQFPYIVWSFDSNLDGIDVGTMSVTVWGLSDSSVDDLCDVIQTLDKETIYDSVVPTYYFESRLNVPNSDRLLKRREMSFSFTIA